MPPHVSSKALVLAAGKSTRIASIAGNLPKPLLPVGGDTVLGHNLSLLSKHGVKNVWINLHYEPEKIKAAVGNGSKWGLEIRFAFEKEILGTAGALKNLEMEFSKVPFFVLYGDNFTDCNLQDIMKTHTASKAVATIAIFDQTRAANSGITGGRVVTDSAGTITQFLEGSVSSYSTSPFVNAGVYAFEPSVLPEIKTGFSDFGKDVFPMLLKQGKKLSSYLITGYCFGMDTPEAYSRAKALAGQKQVVG